MSDNNVNKIEFFRNKIKQNIDSIKTAISEVRYELYMAMIEDCESYSELRDMADIELQLNMIKYAKELENKLRINNIDINELEKASNNSLKATKLAIIKSK